MNKKSIIGLFVLFLVLLPLIQAQPPFETTTGAGMQFAYSPYYYVKENTDFNLHVHVINDTAVQTNTTTSCLLHLYDSDGSHLLKTSLGYEYPEFETTIAGGNFTVGSHAYIIYCNNTGLQNHLVSGDFMVSPSGTEFTTAKAIGYTGLLFVFITLLIILLYKFAMEENYGIKIGYLVGAYFDLIMVVYIAHSLTHCFIIDIPGLDQFLELFQSTLLIGLFPLVIFLVFYLFEKIIQEKEVKKLMGMGYSESEARSFKK